jgi:phosphodiesterase/alkaline phosphatase D-like protein
MSKNLIIGLLVVAVVIVGGVLIVNNMQNPTAYSPTATPAETGGTSPTPTGQTSGTSPAQQATLPTVTADSNTVSSNSTVVVTGKVTPNGAQTSYWYEYGNSSSLGSRTPTQAVGSGFIAISAPAYITGLSANTNYFYRLVAQNLFGTVQGATNTFATNSNPPPQGDAPTPRSSAATSVGTGNANLNGSVNPNGSQTAYWFEYGESSNLGSVSSFQSAGNGTSFVTIAMPVTNLKPSTKYFFRVNAQNQFGTANGATLSFTTQGPTSSGVPAAVTNGATGVGKSSVTLTGHVNPDGAPTTYWFEYSLDSSLTTVLGSTSRTQTSDAGVASLAVSAKVSNLQSNTQYFYRIVATNTNGTESGAIMAFKTSR